MGFGSFWGQTGWPCSKHGSQRQKLLRSSWNWNLVKPNLSYSGIPVCKICRTGLTLGSSNFIWWQASECPEDLARANWKAAFISLIELQILWLNGRKWLNQLTLDCGKVRRAPCQVAYPSRRGSYCIRTLQSHRRPVIQYNVGQTWGLLTVTTAEKQLKLELGKA